MSYVIYRMNDLGEVFYDAFEDDQWSDAMGMVRTRRAEGYKHVIMSTELTGQVGTNDRGGAVVDGKLPDGTPYTWSKAHRAGAKPPK
jgi:hypothetical protein